MCKLDQCSLRLGRLDIQPIARDINMLSDILIYTASDIDLFHVAIETKTSKPNNSASTDQPMT